MSTQIPSPFHSQMHSHAHHTPSLAGATSSDSPAFQEAVKHSFRGPMADSYNERTGGCNIRLSQHLISLTVPHLTHIAPTSPLRILDNASGPLTTTTELLESEFVRARTGAGEVKGATHITATDLSPDFVRTNRETLASPSMSSLPSSGVKIDALEMDSQNLDFPAETFDAVFTSIAIFAFPDPVKGAREIYRTLKREGGVAALTTWKKTWMGLLGEAEDRLFARMEQDADNGDQNGENGGVGAQKHERTRFPQLEAWMRPGKLRDTLIEGGFEAERVTETDVQVKAWWEGKDAFAKSFGMTLGMMVGDKYGGGKEEGRERLEKVFREVLDERERAEELGVVYGEGEKEGWVGFGMVAWCGVAVK